LLTRSNLRSAISCFREQRTPEMKITLEKRSSSDSRSRSRREIRLAFGNSEVAIIYRHRVSTISVKRTIVLVSSDDRCRDSPQCDLGCNPPVVIHLYILNARVSRDSSSERSSRSARAIVDLINPFAANRSVMRNETYRR